MTLAFLSVAGLALLQILLALNVSLNRISSRTSQGCPDDPASPLHRAIVAHRNACEFVPIFCVLILCLPAAGQPLWSEWLGPLALVSRTVHAIGILQFTLARPNPLRRYGAMSTYLIGLTLSILLFMSRL